MSAFYFARMASDIPIDLLLPTVFINLVYWMGETLSQQSRSWSAAYLCVTQSSPQLYRCISSCPSMHKHV